MAIGEYGHSTRSWSRVCGPKDPMQAMRPFMTAIDNFH